METLWYVIVVLMLTGYVVLDGFDFGVGMLYLLTARSEAERKTALASIGPIWNGNEVWLVASGGLLLSGSTTMAWEPATGSLLVGVPLQLGSGRVVRVNPTSGAMAMSSLPERPSRP